MSELRVTEHVAVAHEALRRLLPIYQHQGLGLGTDEWQDLVDAVVRALVYGTALGTSIASLEILRGTYGTHGPGCTALVAIARDGAAVTLNKGDGAWVQAEEGETIDSLRVWEFRSPLLPDLDPAGFDYIWGQARTGDMMEVEVVVRLSDVELYFEP